MIQQKKSPSSAVTLTGADENNQIHYSTCANNLQGKHINAYLSSIKYFQHEHIPFIGYLHYDGCMVIRTDPVPQWGFDDDGKRVESKRQFRAHRTYEKAVEKLKKRRKLIETVASDGETTEFTRYANW